MISVLWRWFIAPNLLCDCCQNRCAWPANMAQPLRWTRALPRMLRQALPAIAHHLSRLRGTNPGFERVIPFPDLLIGATALSLGFSVLTANLRHFRLIPGLSVKHF